MDQKSKLNPDSATKLSAKNDSIQELKAEQDIEHTEAAKTLDGDGDNNEAINIQVPVDSGAKV